MESVHRSNEEGRRELLKYLEEIKLRTEGISTILSQHLRDDTVMRGDVDSLQEWKDGINGKNGAQDNIQNMMYQKYYILGGVGTITFLGAVFGPFIAKAFGI